MTRTVTLVLILLGPSLGLAEPASPPPSTVAICEFAACAITSTHSVACWGLGSDSAEYTPDLVRSKRPRLMSGGRDAHSLACSYRTACSLDGAGRLSCWGLVPGNPKAREVLHPFAGVAIKEVAILDNRTLCVLTRTGSVLCDPKGNPASPRLAQDAEHLVVGAGSLCVQRSEGTVRCGGAIAHRGAMGTSLTPDRELPSLAHATSLAVGTQVACGIVSRVLRCEGDAEELERLGLSAQVGQPADRVVFSFSGDSAGVQVAGRLELGGMVTRITGLTSVLVTLSPADVALHGSGLCGRGPDGHVQCLGTAESWRLGPASTEGSAKHWVSIAVP